MIQQRIPDPCALVIFGASGDLTRRKLVPAIWHLHHQGRLPQAFHLVGCQKCQRIGIVHIVRNRH
ncbi:MAG: hypothetical protein OXH63_20365, partial [Gemmatimonadetes bacterium]|nr:hypothetical protein [Gemmatimonadota bacterium]